VLLDSWADVNLPVTASAYIVGPASIFLWALTLLGSLGIGPVARMRKNSR